MGEEGGAHRKQPAAPSEREQSARVLREAVPRDSQAARAAGTHAEVSSHNVSFLLFARGRKKISWHQIRCLLLVFSEVWQLSEAVLVAVEWHGNQIATAGLRSHTSIKLRALMPTATCTFSLSPACTHIHHL